MTTHAHEKPPPQKTTTKTRYLLGRVREPLLHGIQPVVDQVPALPHLAVGASKLSSEKVASQKQQPKQCSVFLLYSLVGLLVQQLGCGLHLGLERLD